MGGGYKHLDLFTLAALGSYAVMMVIEARYPARRFPQRRGWRRFGLVFLLVNLLVGSLTPLVLPLHFLATRSIFHLSRIDFMVATMIAFLVNSLILFGWHRACHASPLMWRILHQLHHSPQRVDLAGASLAHPLDSFARTVIGIVVTIGVLGATPEVAAASGLLLTLAAMVPHWNVRTPPWLGYLVQRPEAHCLHHERHVHASNYSDFPLWDMIFGSFANPAVFAGEVGFDPPADRRSLAMLLGTDVDVETEPPPAVISLGAHIRNAASPHANVLGK